ncbi:MAG TPA: 16S rRNA (guanine(527)-N(7))-methyltransferase RsmG [Tepidisphaeraceae bacterium]|nr:16S rRNA (guanine(527)-N(7))-methyltransferase RsmG [Tepidisphaeraceae bacterium]
MNPLWNQIARQANIELDAERQRQLSLFLDLLLAANQQINLTRITDRAAADVQHVGDALTLLPYLPTGSICIADVGSGGGVPGLPIAIVRPESRITLIESTKKKCRFLSETSRQLGLSNVEVIDQRAESIIGRKFDVVISRAVAELKQLVQWCLPLTRPGGKMLAMKGPKWKEEANSAATIIARLRGMQAQVREIDLPGLAGHVILEIAKLA